MFKFTTLLPFGFLAALAACGGPVSFSGQSAIHSTPPAAPALASVSRVKLVGNHVEISEKIQFEGGKAIILPSSATLLQEIAKTINDNTAIQQLEIQGHASSEGSKDANKKLSDDRAKAVMVALVALGVKPTVLTAKGYGSEKPLVTPEKTEEDRERNRRVEFVVTK